MKNEELRKNCGMRMINLLHNIKKSGKEKIFKIDGNCLKDIFLNITIKKIVLLMY